MSIEKLEAVTGLTRRDIDALWQQVKANNKLLATCPRHDFSIEHDKRGTLVAKWRCAHCGGVVGTADKRWYERGLAHAASLPCCSTRHER